MAAYKHEMKLPDIGQTRRYLWQCTRRKAMYPRREVIDCCAQREKKASANKPSV